MFLPVFGGSSNLEQLRDEKDSPRAALRDLPGVNYLPYQGTVEEHRSVRESARVLVDCGVEFAHCEPGRVPWLVSVQPFHLEPETRLRVEQLGAATFAFFDAVQELYAGGDPIVRDHLDANAPPDLRGLQIDQRLQTFRLDIVLRDGMPKVTEIEEIYGNAGKMVALQRAYEVDYRALFQHFADLDISAIFLDDALPDYYSELELVRRELAERYHGRAKLAYFSRFSPYESGTVWRFCKTKDFAQYPLDLRHAITGSRCRFVNPLFQSYGTKAVLALPYHPLLAEKFESMLGPETARIIREGFTRSRFLERNPSPQVVEELEAAHKTSVLKVVDCPGGLDFTWGSRGVWFGDRSASRWRKAVGAAVAGRIPNHEQFGKARFIVSELVESDRFDVPFLHPESGELALMTRARIRLGPIFFRAGGRSQLVAGHATFVNTSRKIHLGKHAVCAPLAV